MFLLNELKTPDIIFFVSIVLVVVLCVGLYFLMPIINHKKYEERRANLKKREESFRKNLKMLKGEDITIDESITEEVVESDAQN